MAEKNFEHVSHKKSQHTRDIAPKEFYGLTPTANNSDNVGSSPVKLNLAKRPTPEQLIEGEIAVNYLKGHETLTIKNTENEIVGFVNENDFNEAQEVVALGLAQEKNERITDNARFDDKFEEFDKNIDDLELVISSALNDLNSRILDNEDAIEDLSDEIGETIERELTEIVTTINEITERIDENELAVSSSLNDLNARIVENDEKIAEIENTFDEFDEGIERIELAVSSSLNDLNTRINEANEDIDDMLSYVDGKVTEVYNQLNNNDETQEQKIRTLTEAVSSLDKEVKYGGDRRCVDLGLPSGLLWGKYNIGSNMINELEYGLYYAWGETQGYDSVEVSFNRTFDDASYKWKWTDSRTNNEPLKYNTTDTYKTLAPIDDAAKQNWRGAWRMPTKEDVQELIDNTTQEFVGNNGGFYVFTSNINGNKIYFPCAGIADSSVSDTGGYVYLWTKTLDETNNHKAYYLWCSGANYQLRKEGRQAGMSVRGVFMPRRR